jgi:hypothetical protein
VTPSESVMGCSSQITHALGQFGANPRSSGVDHPAMPERIMEGRRSAVVARFRAAIQRRTVCYGGRGNRVAVEHLQMQ